MQRSNYQIISGQRLDTGRKWKDAEGVFHVIYEKVLDVSAMSGTTTKNVPHDENLDVERYAIVRELFLSDGTTVRGVGSGDPVATIDATNVVLDPTASMTGMAGQVTIEFCLEDES